MIRKKKILWVLNTFRYSAIEILVKSLIKDEVISNNYQLIILQIDDKKFLPAYDLIDNLKNNNVQFESIDYKTFFGFPRLNVLIKTFFMLKRIEPNLIHIYCERYSFVLGIISKFLRIPCVRTVCHIFDLGNGFIPNLRRISKIIQRYILRKLNILFLTNSDTNSQHEKEYYFNPNAESVYCWFDPEEYSLYKKQEFSSKIASDKQIKLATLGGNWPYKNFDSILKAFQLIKISRPDIYEKLSLTQIGSENEKLINLSKKLEISKKCKFIGNVSDWRSYLANCDYIIAPSIEEGLNLSVVEASAFGLIPILSTRKCLNEHKRLGKDVIWLEDIDPYSISKKIISLDKYFSEDLTLKQTRIAESAFFHYSSKKLIPKLLKIYDFAIQKSHNFKDFKNR